MNSANAAAPSGYIHSCSALMCGLYISLIEDFNSALSDYKNHLFKDRHFGRDCQNPGPMDGFKLTIHGTGCPLPGGHDELADNLTK